MAKWFNYEDWKALREWKEEMELSMAGYWVKSDLIGLKWYCPRCRETEVITKKGIEHYRPDHLRKESLEDIFAFRMAARIPCIDIPLNEEQNKKPLTPDEAYERV